jgi:hypothetical protein
MAEGVRRIVTGHDENGNAIVVKDAPAHNIVTSPSRPGVVIYNLWATDSMPCRIDGPEETTDSKLGLEPKPNGTNFRIIDFPPESTYIDKVTGDMATQAFSETMGASHALDSSGKQRHPFMHKTKTVDYAICLEGEFVCVLDESEVTMKTGDVMIQRGTNHAWANRSDRTARIAFVLIDAER